jgi:hypothetical protein
VAGSEANRHPAKAASARSLIELRSFFESSQGELEQAMPTTKRLQELIIAVHFDTPIALTVVDLANWVTHFSSQFPVVQQCRGRRHGAQPKQKGPLMAGFCDSGDGLHIPDFTTSEANLPKVSGRDREYSRLWETDAGDWFDPTARYSPIRHFLCPPLRGN